MTAPQRLMSATMVGPPVSRAKALALVAGIILGRVASNFPRKDRNTQLPRMIRNSIIALVFNLTLVAQTPILLEDFRGTSIRSNGSTDLWFAYLGEDPDQIYSLLTATNPHQFQVVGSTSTSALSTISAISTATPAVLTASAPVPFHSGDLIALSGVAGTGCSSFSGSGIATLIDSTHYNFGRVSGAGCAYTQASGHAQACQTHGCGVYTYMFPSANGIFTAYPNQWVYGFAYGSAPLKTVNHLRFYFKCNKAVPRFSPGGSLLQIGTFTRRVIRLGELGHGAWIGGEFQGQRHRTAELFEGAGDFIGGGV